MIDEEQKQKAREDAYMLLSYRERSIKEITTRLLKKGHKREVIEAIIPKIKELGYLDDQRFAIKWVKHKANHSPKGRYLLIKELKQKGVDEKYINAALNKEYPYKFEFENALKLAKKWRNKSRNKEKDIVKLKVYLKNKGFGYEIISDVVNELNE